MPSPAALKSEINLLQQKSELSIPHNLDLETLKFKEDLNTVKNDIQSELAMYRSDNKELKQRNELAVQELGHRLMISISELKSEADRIKLELLTKWATGIVLSVSLFAIGISKVI